MSKNYLVPTNLVVSTCAHFRPYFDGGNVCARGSGIRSVSGDHYLSYLRTRSTTSLFESVSTLESDEVTCYNTFLSGGCRGCWHSIESYSNMPMCALIIETFSAFFPLKVNLWWEKWEDSPSTLKDDSLSELYSLTQSMSLCSRFSRSIRSLSVSSFFFSLRIFIWARCSAYPATSFSGTMYLSENFLIASLSPLTSSLSSNNSLIWARGWIKSSGSWPLVRFAFQER